MIDQKLEQKLASALSRTAPNDLEGVVSRCEVRKGRVIQMTTKKRKSAIRNLVAACLALALVGGAGGIFYQQTYAVAAIVSLDVNPSIELKVNKNEKVLVCEALNTEAEAVLADMNGGADLKGTKLDVAVNAIVGALVRNGHLDSISSAILISVEDKDQTRAAKLQQELTSTVDIVLQAQASEAAVLSQTVKKDSAVEKKAKENHISTGKAALVTKVMELNNSLAFEKLSVLSVEELKDLLETRAPGMPIGREAAAEAACKYAGVESSAKVRWEVDAELDANSPHYEVEVYTSKGEFEYDVGAYTGKVLRGKANILDGVETVPENEEQIGESKAFDLAVADFHTRYPELKNSSILHQRVELDEDDGRLYYDVKFYLNGCEADYNIDAKSGHILEYDTDYKPPVHKTESVSGSNVDGERAKAIALAHAGLTEAEVFGLHVEKDEDDGRMVYEIEFRTRNMEYEYTVDGATGVVLEHEKDWDD